MVETLLFFTISFLIGLLIGIERERSHAEGLTVIGVRTFMLFSILGTLAATLNQLPLTMAISLFVFGIILLSYVRSIIKGEADNSNGITTEISAAIIYCLGYLIPTAALVAITISAIVLLILYERKRLHKLARKKFKPHEIEAAIILIIFALGILPILPSHTIDPWGLFNPRNFGVLIATIAAIQFGGYVAIRLFGERFGMAAMGFSGGLVSSTAFFATLPSTLRSRLCRLADSSFFHHKANACHDNCWHDFYNYIVALSNDKTAGFSNFIESTEFIFCVGHIFISWCNINSYCNSKALYWDKRRLVNFIFGRAI
jgi:hypothetical protein